MEKREWQLMFSPSDWVYVWIGTGGEGSMKHIVQVTQSDGYRKHLLNGKLEEAEMPSPGDH